MSRTKSKENNKSYIVCGPLVLVLIFVVAFIVAFAVVWIVMNYTGGCGVNLSSSNSIGQQNYFSPTDEFREQNVLKVDGTTIIIGRDCMAIVADTSEERADAIAVALENATSERPSAWDGWVSTLGAFNITFEAVTFYARTEDAYISRAIFRRGAEVLDLDMRPSDAIALALRTRTPIYMNMTLLNEAGERIC